MSILRPLLHPTKSFQKLIWVYTKNLCLYTHKIVFLWVLSEDFFYIPKSSAKSCYSRHFWVLTLIFLIYTQKWSPNFYTYR